MQPNYKKIIISPILQILNLLGLLGTMFLYNTYRWHYYSSYYWYYDDYEYVVHHNFFESVFSDVFPGIFGVLLFLNMLLLLVLSITSLCLKKPNFINIISAVVPFLIVLDYVGYIVSVLITDNYSIEEDGLFMIIPLCLLFFVGIAELIFSLVYMSKNKQTDRMVSGVDPAYAPVPPVYNFDAPAAPVAAPDKKYCARCGNECVTQAIICPNCGCSFQ